MNDTSKRFSSPEHLAAFKERGVFPVIHEPLFNLVLERAEGTSFMDLCCHFGLLGERLRRHIRGARAVGVEMDAAAVEAGRAAGVQIPLHVMKVEPKSLGSFIGLITEHQVTTLVARRCLSEVFVTDHAKPTKDEAFAAELRRQLRAAGVREVFAQGRAPTARATWPIPDIEAEVALLAPEFTLVDLRGQCAYLCA